MNLLRLTIPRPQRRPRLRSAGLVASAAAVLLTAFSGAARAQSSEGAEPAVTAPPATAGTPAATAAEATPAPVPATYKVMAGDVLRIAVPGRPELTELLMVPEDGRISFPYVREFRAADLTCAQIAARIKGDLKKEFRDPPVVVQVARRHRKIARVLGDAIDKPGALELTEDSRLLDLLMASGGLKAGLHPQWAKATLIRSKSPDATEIDLPRLMSGADPALNIPLKDGDTVFVQTIDATRRRIQVVGAVMDPGEVPATGEMSLMEVVNARKGFAPTAALGQARIKRGEQTIPVDLTDLAVAGKEQPNVKLYPGDVLEIPTSRTVAVAGAVATPGRLPYPDKSSVTALNALMGAGGPSGNADLKNASIVRKPEGTSEPVLLPLDLEKVLKDARSKAKEGKPSTAYGDLVMQPGDVLHVPAKGQPSGRINVFQAITSTLGALWWLL